jgi:hypothetical protein
MLRHEAQWSRAASSSAPTHVTDPHNLISLLCEPLPAGDVIVASAGEWRREINGSWRFWPALAWLLSRPPLRVTPRGSGD